MALAFPLGRTTFWERLELERYTWTLDEAMSTSETGGGEVLTAVRGTRLWTVSVSVVLAEPATQEPLSALMSLIRQPGASFFAYDPRRRFPQSDPTGSVNPSGCTVQSVAANRRDVTLEGMPNGFALTAGDHVSIAHLSAPTRHYLGQVVTGATFASDTATIELAPSIPLGVVPGDVVTLHRPFTRMRYVPDTYSGITRQSVVDGGFTFTARQTYR